jgi:hypothetical protein
MINEYGTVSGMRIDRGNLPQWHFVHHKSHMISPGIESELQGFCMVLRINSGYFFKQDQPVYLCTNRGTVCFLLGRNWILGFEEFRVCRCQIWKANKLRKIFLLLVFDLILLLLLLLLLFNNYFRIISFYWNLFFLHLLDLRYLRRWIWSVGCSVL